MSWARACSPPDVVVIGAGPVGCVTALAFARGGAHVLLLEGNPEASKRLAGEWLHPPGAVILDSLGLRSLFAASPHPVAGGFVFFPEDGSAPIPLDYGGPTQGLACEHGELVRALRETAAACDGIDYVPFARVTTIVGRRVSYNVRDGGAATVSAGRIVGADGRSSLVRRQLESSPRRRRLSHMAGVLLEDAELPYEGMGHVIMGGPGPALVYRIGPTRVRACLDVPVHALPRDRGAYLWGAFAAALPPTLRVPFRRALEKGAVSWAVNEVRFRGTYGRGPLALVGDAVGHAHPLTAAGLTLGFMDGECLARASSLERYRDERERRSRAPELLATFLYDVLTFAGDGGQALRSAVYRMWRDSADERRRTMRLLAVEETDVLELCRPFLKAIVTATDQVVKRVALTREAHHAAQTLACVAERLAWFARIVLPGAIRSSARSAARPLGLAK